MCVYQCVNDIILFFCRKKCASRKMWLKSIRQSLKNVRTCPTWLTWMRHPSCGTSSLDTSTVWFTWVFHATSFPHNYPNFRFFELRLILDCFVWLSIRTSDSPFTLPRLSSCTWARGETKSLHICSPFQTRLTEICSPVSTFHKLKLKLHWSVL